MKKLKLVAVCFGCAVSMAVLMKYPSLSADGIRKGLEISAQTMIPSLFPFLVLSSFASSSGAIDFIGQKTDKFFKKFFKFSGKAGSTFLFSLLSGFPVGCSMASTLYENKSLTQTEAKRIALSSVNAGPAFVIGAVGTMMLSSFKAGVIIFASLTLSSILICFFSQFILSDSAEPVKTAAAFSSLSESLVSSVYSASKSMLSVCQWILIFSCTINIISGNIENEKLMSFLKAILEVSIGCEEMSQTKNPAIIAAVIGWSGISVHFQVFPYIIKIGLDKKLFICTRLLQSTLSAVICFSLIKIFPCEISVFSNYSSAAAKTFTSTAPAAAGLLLMCAIFILDLDRHKKLC